MSARLRVVMAEPDSDGPEPIGVIAARMASKLLAIRAKACQGPRLRVVGCDPEPQRVASQGGPSCPA